MSQSSLQTVAADLPKPRTSAASALWRSLKSCALLGILSFLLLAVIECFDLNMRLGNLFESPLDRIAFSAYFSPSLLIGSVVGLLVGLSGWIASLLFETTRRIVSVIGGPRVLHGAVAYFGVAAVGAFVLNQFRPINLYVLGVIREAEKLSFLRVTLLNHERASSYLLVMGLLIACSLTWYVARATARYPRIRIPLILGLGLVILTAYWVDSRVSVQLYEYTMHRSLYLLEVAAAMAIVAAVHFSRSRSDSFPGRTSKRKNRLSLAALIVLAVCVAFTFLRLDTNQRLKALVFSRTTQMKQNLRLARWALDFDRDGYSPLLGGGDRDDGQATINPGMLEVVEDGIDNNSIGSDLTRTALDEWKAESESCRPAIIGSTARYNVVFFFIDTVRADHLSTYGYGRRTTPNLDKLGSRSAVFENAFTPSPRTSEAVQKFMQSSYWDAHLEAWTQILARNGYNTMLFPGRRSWERYKEWMPVVRKAQGRPLKENIDVAIETLSQTPSDSPFCAYIYIPDPHQPYIRHDDFAYGDSVTDLYDGELSYTDHHVGRFLDWMEQAGRLANTIVVIMSDHGESLGERGIYLHSTQLYNEQTRVPLIIHIPNQPARRIPDYVTTVDLGSTILHAVGIEYPKEHAGVSLVPLIRGEPFEHPPVYGEQTSQEISPFVRLDQQIHPEGKKYMVVTQDGFKLIYNRDPYSFELFDLKADPGELRNLYDHLPDKAQSMRRLIGRFVDVVTASRPPDADEGRYSRSGGIDGDKVE
jgi:arylsulfatase A-like enzyme